MTIKRQINLVLAVVIIVINNLAKWTKTQTKILTMSYSQ